MELVLPQSLSEQIEEDDDDLDKLALYCLLTA